MPLPTEKEINEFREQVRIAQDITLESLKNVAEKGEIFSWAAKAYRQLYLKLIEEGFKQEEALAIVQRYNPIQK